MNTSDEARDCQSSPPPSDGDLGFRVTESRPSIIKPLLPDVCLWLCSDDDQNWSELLSKPLDLITRSHLFIDSTSCFKNWYKEPTGTVCGSSVSFLCSLFLSCVQMINIIWVVSCHRL